MRPDFVPGLALARRFFVEAVEPAVADAAPGLRYAAALIGDGSEVLGFDDPVSADHDWGPRVLIFLGDEDHGRHAGDILEQFERSLPKLFASWPVAFADQDRFVGIDTDAGLSGSAAHGVEVHSLSGWIRRELGADLAFRQPTADEWRALDEQKLLSVTAGAVFRDDCGDLSGLRSRLAFFPLDVRLEKMARLWSAAAAEMPFVGRAGDVGDALGSRLIAGRLVEQAMRLCFLIDGRYAPYSKWFGTAWAGLPSAVALREPIERVLAAEAWREREAALAETYLAVALRHSECGLPGEFEPRVTRYFTRPYHVINADEIAGALTRRSRSTRG